MKRTDKTTITTMESWLIAFSSSYSNNIYTNRCMYVPRETERCSSLVTKIPRQWLWTYTYIYWTEKRL